MACWLGPGSGKACASGTAAFWNYLHTHTLGISCVRGYLRIWPLFQGPVALEESSSMLSCSRSDFGSWPLDPGFLPSCANLWLNEGVLTEFTYQFVFGLSYLQQDPSLLCVLSCSFARSPHLPPFPSSYFPSLYPCLTGVLFEKGASCGAQANLTLATIPLPLPSKCWNDRHVPPSSHVTSKRSPHVRRKRMKVVNLSSCIPPVTLEGSYSLVT